MAKKLCELAHDEAIEIIKNELVMYIPWYIQGGFNKKLKFAGDYFDPIPTEKAIEKIKSSGYGATIWKVDGKYIVKAISNMF